jgi:hypothetical protein
MPVKPNTSASFLLVSSYSTAKVNGRLFWLSRHVDVDHSTYSFLDFLDVDVEEEELSESISYSYDLTKTQLVSISTIRSSSSSEDLDLEVLDDDFK